jgi:periplasmic divalent cation tolerance protein
MAASTENTPRIVLTTVDDPEQAKRLARELIEHRLAACVSIIEGVGSTYRWRGAVTEQREILLLVKTTAHRLSHLQDWLQRSHPYEVPEILALEALSGSAPYLRWLIEETEPSEERP